MLPFIVGALAGAAAVIAFTKKKELKEGLEQGVCKAKEVAEEMKKSVDGTIECIKSKKALHVKTKEEVQ
ncbi:hypothetical protein [Sulfurospirillum halorespirans]|uniref:YtxH-like protein n=1 Tax=Sulfurospirillum halorespirans DSM 13726 TaxID=1193502 RepID=A0A1D7TMP0_9BACT|nr:hypothetical protein [Sulfurospirillum halorespirans]AOO66266.1 hypothetical protein SHALO_2507 [Sulfurospirillum halorespirans DSM 13726]